MSGGSFSAGVGEWIGAAEVYDADGRFAGMGRDTRTVRADDHAGQVTVEVTFDGPFSLSGTYTIVDHGSYRTYEGPLNVGLAEALGDGLVAAHNYWPDLGLSQRFFLMVMPDGTRQLSLALLSRGDRLHWTVVGEYQRRVDPSAPEPPPTMPMDPSAPEPPPTVSMDPSAPEPPTTVSTDPSALREDPTAGRGEILLLRAGRWSGRLNRLGPDLEPCGTAAYVETVASGGDQMEVEQSGLGFASDVSFRLSSDGWAVWTPMGDVAGSAILSGGRGLSGQFHHHADGLRVWRREAGSLDGTTKAVLHTWYRGEQRVGVAYGTMAFDPA